MKIRNQPLELSMHEVLQKLEVPYLSSHYA